jgi:ppGpp synthetase/RelA/SpoT-type nucleotidyltranferase
MTLPAFAPRSIPIFFLGLESDVEDIIAIRIMEKYLNEIGPIAVSVQKKYRKG